MNDTEMVALLKIMLSSTESQLKTETTDTMKSYLEGYQAAVKLMIEYAEKK